MRIKVFATLVDYVNEHGEKLDSGEGAAQANLAFAPVCPKGEYCPEGSEENKKFWEATPSGLLELSIANIAAVPKGLKQGDEFYIDITPCGQEVPVKEEPETQVESHDCVGVDLSEDLLDDYAKTLGNTSVDKAKDNVKDLEVFGNGDMFKLLSKASSQREGWMKSTKAMDIPGVGVLVQVTTQQDGEVAEALAFVPGAKIAGDGEERTLAKR